MMLNISADAILSYIAVAFAGFFVKYLWDKIVKEKENRDDKVQKYDEKEMKALITKIASEACEEHGKQLTAQIEAAKAESKATYEYWQKMYWDAVHRLEEAQTNFKRLEEQDIIFYKYLLIDTCKDYIAMGGMTQYQFDRLAEWYKIYKTLGGNGQGDLYYKKAVALPIVHKEDLDYSNSDISNSNHNSSIFDYNEQVKDRELPDIEH